MDENKTVTKRNDPPPKDTMTQNIVSVSVADLSGIVKIEQDASEPS